MRCSNASWIGFPTTPPDRLAAPSRCTCALPSRPEPCADRRHRGDRFWDQTSKPEVSPEDVAIFEEGYAEAVARCESILARDPDNILALYYLGVTQSVKAAWEMTILRSYFGGSRAMRGAVKNHRRVREIDPDYADVYQVLGVYDYGIATLPRALRFLARLFGLRGEKERGIEWVARDRP